MRHCTKILYLITLTSILLPLAHCQAQPYEEKKEEASQTEEDSFEVVEITMDTWKDTILGSSQDQFIIFTDLECRECRRGATQLAKLANMTQDNPLIGRVDCMKNPLVCNIFKDRESKNKQLPRMILISQGIIYQYSGKIDAEAIFKWISESQFKQNKKSFVHRNIDEFVQNAEQDLRKEQMQKSADQGSLIGSLIPLGVSDQFDALFRSTVSSLFYNIGYDHFSKQTKVSLFCILILAPGVLFAYLFIYNSFADFIDPPPMLVPADDEFLEKPKGRKIQPQAQQQMQPQGQPAQQPQNPQTAQEQAEMYRQQAEYFKAQAKACEAYVEQIESMKTQAAEPQPNQQESNSQKQSPSKKQKKKKNN